MVNFWKDIYFDKISCNILFGYKNIFLDSVCIFSFVIYDFFMERNNIGGFGVVFLVVIREEVKINFWFIFEYRSCEYVFFVWFYVLEIEFISLIILFNFFE